MHAIHRRRMLLMSRATLACVMLVHASVSIAGNCAKVVPGTIRAVRALPTCSHNSSMGLRSRGTCRPLHPLDSILLEEIIDHSRSVWTRIVVLKDKALPNPLCVWEHVWLHHFIPIALSVKISLDMDEVCLPGLTYATPHHHRSATILDHRLYTVLGKSFPSPSPHPQTSIHVMKTESRFVCEEDTSPLGSCPVTMTSRDS